MTNQNPVDGGRVLMRLPPDLFGGNTRGLLDHLGFDGRHIESDLWAVKIAKRQDAELIRWYVVADESGRRHRFELLDKLAESPVTTSHLAGMARELQDQLLERFKAPDDLAAVFHSIQVDMAMGQQHHVASLIKSAYDNIGSRMPSNSTGEPAFPNRSVHVVTASEFLIRRVRLPGIIFRFDQDPDALDTLRAIQQGQTSQPEQYFASSSDWYLNVVGVSHYLGPLLGCLTPRFWGFHVYRTLAIILFSLGRDLSGLRSAPMELIQLLPISGARERPPIHGTSLAPTSCAEATDWWAMRLNQMFGYLSDPTTFADADGVYAPHDHHHWLLTFDQVFGLMTSLQGACRDFAAQRALMNNLLDIFADRILDLDFVDKLCSLRYAKEKADEVRSKMPAKVAALLMPAADRAVAALEHVQDGFFIQRQRGDAEVRLRMPDGSWESRSPSKAAALLLKLHRNATHGFGQRKGKGARAKSELDASLLVHHHGQMPADIVLLPYLYLLDTLCNPERVRKHIARKVATPD
jgi:hypothetical protein